MTREKLEETLDEEEIRAHDEEYLKWYLESKEEDEKKETEQVEDVEEEDKRISGYIGSNKYVQATTKRNVPRKQNRIIKNSEEAVKLIERVAGSAKVSQFLAEIEEAEESGNIAKARRLEGRLGDILANYPEYKKARDISRSKNKKARRTAKRDADQLQEAVDAYVEATYGREEDEHLTLADKEAADKKAAEFAKRSKAAQKGAETRKANQAVKQAANDAAYVEWYNEVNGVGKN